MNSLSLMWKGSIDRAFAENVLGPMEWEKWNVLFDEVSNLL